MLGSASLPPACLGKAQAQHNESLEQSEARTGDEGLRVQIRTPKSTRSHTCFSFGPVPETQLGAKPRLGCQRQNLFPETLNVTRVGL